MGPCMRVTAKTCEALITVIRFSRVAAVFRDNQGSRTSGHFETNHRVPGDPAIYRPQENPKRAQGAQVQPCANWTLHPKGT